MTVPIGSDPNFDAILQELDLEFSTGSAPKAPPAFPKETAWEDLGIQDLIGAIENRVDPSGVSPPAAAAARGIPSGTMAAPSAHAPDIISDDDLDLLLMDLDLEGAESPPAKPPLAQTPPGVSAPPALVATPPVSPTPQAPMPVIQPVAPKPKAPAQAPMTQPVEPKPHLDSTLFPEEPPVAPAKPKGGKKHWILQTLFGLILVAIIAFSIVLAVTSQANKSLFGMHFYSIASESMQPTFYKGDLIFVKETGVEGLDTGDILTAWESDEKIITRTHRLVQVVDAQHTGEAEDMIITKGDHNVLMDQPFSASLLVGRCVFHIPKLGGILLWMREHIVATVSILAGIILLVVLWYLLKPKLFKNAKKRKKVSATPANG